LQHLTRACFGFFVVQDSFASRPSEWRYIFVFMSTLWTFRAQKIINLKREWCILLFFSICCFAMECPIVWKQYWQEQCRSESWSETFSCSCIWIFLNCNLVFYETRGCAWGSLNADFIYVHGSICFYLGTQIMFENFWSNFS
jgi:hypothetical protein